MLEIGPCQSIDASACMQERALLASSPQVRPEMRAAIQLREVVMCCAGLLLTLGGSTLCTIILTFYNDLTSI